MHFRDALSTTGSDRFVGFFFAILSVRSVIFDCFMLRLNEYYTKKKKREKEANFARVSFIGGTKSHNNNTSRFAKLGKVEQRAVLCELFLSRSFSIKKIVIKRTSVIQAKAGSIRIRSALHYITWYERAKL